MLCAVAWSIRTCNLSRAETSKGQEGYKMTGFTGFWTEIKVEQLIGLWRDGKSASEIATEIRAASRNAVIGKISRMGLNGDKPKPPQKPEVEKVRMTTRKNPVVPKEKKAPTIPL